MGNNISDYSNLKANMQGMQQFFKDNGVQISAKDSQTIASIFKQCDTEGKKDANGKEVGDGVLNEKERDKFADMLQKVLPEALYKKVETFIVVADVMEGLRAEKNAKNNVENSK